uniref:Uncharacterized protein n=2 Tax=Clytia hemisphaerica TaxID=252671 RepID=A0A7M5WR94_9CNID
MLLEKKIRYSFGPHYNSFRYMSLCIVESFATNLSGMDNNFADFGSFSVNEYPDNKELIAPNKEKLVTDSDTANMQLNGFSDTTSEVDDWATGFEEFKSDNNVNNVKDLEENVDKCTGTKDSDDDWAVGFQEFNTNTNTNNTINKNETSSTNSSLKFQAFGNDINGVFQNFANTSDTFSGFEDNTFVADFQSFEKTNLPEHQKSRTILRESFEYDDSLEGNSEPTLLETSFKESCLCRQMQEEFDKIGPVKAKSLQFYKNKLEFIKQALDETKLKEDWLIKIERADIGIYRNHFDFHSMYGNSPKDRVNSTKRLPPPKNLSLTNGHSIKPGSPPPKEITEILESPRKLSETSNKTQSECFVTSQKSLIEEAEMKKSMIELSSKNVEDLRSIVNELEIEAKIYSELLLSELDYRDQLVRQQEVKNRFISTHLAVERKINEAKKKKKGYGFFKGNDDVSTRCLEWTIPYIQYEDGLSTSELTLITDVLSSIEKDDPETPKRISEYVFKLGNSFDLDTVIQVRTQDGVKTIGSPGQVR